MKERPILFSATMVRAILAGTKTQTRRIVKPQPEKMHDGEPYWFIGGYRAWTYRPTTDPLRRGGNELRCPYGVPGDRLWVRETFGHFERNDTLKQGARIYYRADGECIELEPWRPSIHMPRWASRITLEITGVRVERLQEISEPDAVAEGCKPRTAGHGPDGAIKTYRTGYVYLWNSINGEKAWLDNPWVWVITFKRIEEQS